MYDEYIDRVSEVVTGIVQQAGDRNNVLVDLGKVEALLPRSEQVDGERYEQGSRIKAVITEVRSGTKGPQVILSRRDPELIKTLFELEVPEIADGLVEIRGVAREPGYRSKIAVESHAQGVDPVGACVGPRGSRVRMVVSELRGEKIDIIPWNTEPARFVAKALSPARVREVYLDDDAQGGDGRRPRRPARARDRQGGHERPPRRAPHRLEDRHPVRHRVRAGRRPTSPSAAATARRRLLRPLLGDPLERQALPERVAARLALLRRPRAPGARAARARRRGRPDRRGVRAGARGARGRGRGGRHRGRGAESSRARSSRQARRRADRGEDRARVARPPVRRGGADAGVPSCRRTGRGGDADRGVSREPVRRCAGCGRRAPQRELVRFARTRRRARAGARAPGRGAYTCRRLACFERARAPRLRAGAAPGPSRSIPLSRISTLRGRWLTEEQTESSAPPARRQRPGQPQAPRRHRQPGGASRAQDQRQGRGGRRTTAPPKTAARRRRRRPAPSPSSPASPSATSRRRSASRWRRSSRS